LPRSSAGSPARGAAGVLRRIYRPIVPSLSAGLFPASVLPASRGDRRLPDPAGSFRSARRLFSSSRRDSAGGAVGLSQAGDARSLGGKLLCRKTSEKSLIPPEGDSLDDGRRPLRGTPAGKSLAPGLPLLPECGNQPGPGHSFLVRRSLPELQGAPFPR